MKKQLSNIKRYWVMRTIHWVCALIFFVLALATGYLFDSVTSADERIQVYDDHVAVGLVFVLLGVFRLFWNILYGEERTEFFGRWQQIIAHINFFILHILMLVLVFSGIIAVMAAGKDMHFFLFDIPYFNWMVNHKIKYLAHETHRYSVYISYGFLLLHLLGAITHIRIVEPLIKRMLGIK